MFSFCLNNYLFGLAMTKYDVANNGVLFAWLVGFSDHEERKVGVC